MMLKDYKNKNSLDELLHKDNPYFIVRDYSNDEQGTKEWKDDHIVGGSTLGASFGMSSFCENPKQAVVETCFDITKTPLVALKLNKYHQKQEEYLQQIFEYGHANEESIVKMIASQHPFIKSLESKGITVKNVLHTDHPQLIVDKENPYLQGSIDGLIEMSNGDIYILECKTHKYGKGSFEVIKKDKDGNEILNLDGENIIEKTIEYTGKQLTYEEYIKKHPDYLIQVYHYLSIVGKDPKVKGVLIGIEDRNQELDKVIDGKIINEGSKDYHYYRVMKNGETVKRNIKCVRHYANALLRLQKEYIETHTEIFGKDGWNKVVNKAKALYDYSKNKKVKAKGNDDYPPKQ